MARATNRQSRSVGNLGDALKHAALVELACMLVDRGSTVSYVDTHTFLLHSEIAELGRFLAEVERLEAKHSAYARYASIERESLERTGRYRCSSGVVVRVLGDRRVATTLGEANGMTRAELRDQIRSEELADVLVVDDAATAVRSALASVERAGSVLIHVDPFSLSPELWASLAAGLDLLCTRSTEVVLVVYRYTRSARSSWPTAPSGAIGPVAETRGGPHELATYASARIAGAVREVCAALGWRTN
jgi:23S rRNA A2030 N6-methylase RlmJ